ncbi:MAG: insulinase family protein [Clostridia bacterium]|nr:insulinase family protein [Clostridia bacterium]
MEKQRTLKNGIELYSYENPSVHGFFISLFLKAGSMYEREDESGITHFLEHVSIRNVNALMNGALYPTLDKYGIEFNASTYNEMVQFYISGAGKNFKLGAEILSHVISPIVLTAAEIDTERQRIKAEIRENDENTSLVAFTNAIVHKGTTLASSITGTAGSTSRITRTRLEAYRRRVFTKENLFLYVTGSFDDSDLDALADAFGERELYSGEVHENIAPVPLDFGKRAPHVHIKNADFTMARFTFDMDMSRVGGCECDLIYDMLLGGYSSRFFVEMSERRGLFYDITGNVERYKNIGTFAFSFEVRADMLAESVRCALGILLELMRVTPSDDECMKAGYVDNAAMLLDDSRELNFTLAYDSHIMDERYASLDERTEKYRRIDGQMIRSAAIAIFAPENLTLTLKGRKKRIKTDELDGILAWYKKAFYEEK